MSRPSTTTNRNYVPALDGLRTLAVALVVLHHLSFRTAPGGRIGVDIFFVLSGFLITSVLLREYQFSGRVSLLAFYMRRALRLMPALIFMVACEYAIGTIFGSPDPHRMGSALFAVTYMMDFVRSFSLYSEGSSVGHTWSLAVEEHFYLVWPLLIAPVMAVSPVRRAPIILIGAALVVLWRSYLLFHGASHNRIYYLVDMRSDQLFIGCAAATWLSFGPAAFASAWLARLWPMALLSLIAIAAIGDGESKFALALIPPFAGIVSAILILAVSRPGGGIPARILGFGPMVYLGKISYGIYLWHYPMLLDVREHTANKAAAAGAVVFAIIIAALSYRFIEMPCLRLKRHFERGGEAGPPIGPPVDSDDATGKAAATTA